MTSGFEAKPSLLVIGSRSMVGSRFCELAKDKAQIIQADLHGENRVDITDSNQIEELFSSHQADWAVLFSAYTDVDGAELQRDDRQGSCWRINVEGTGNVVEACRKHGIGLIFISTDYVFDGQKGGPYKEDDPTGQDPAKISWYGLSKIEGEKLVRTLKKFIILRITYPYRADFPDKTDFARGILEKYKEGKLPPMFSDQQTTPTFVDDLSPAILHLVSKNAQGIFHLGSSDSMSPYEFAKHLIATFGLDPSQVTEGSLVQFLKNSKTPRPVKCGMVVDKIKLTGFSPTSWRDGIAKMYAQTKELKLI